MKIKFNSDNDLPLKKVLEDDNSCYICFSREQQTLCVSCFR